MYHFKILKNHIKSKLGNAIERNNFSITNRRFPQRLATRRLLTSRSVLQNFKMGHTFRNFEKKLWG
jgi:hypothetical protein